MRRGNYSDKNGKDRPAAKLAEVAESYDAPFRGYINLTLTPEQRENFPSWCESSAYWLTLEYQVGDGVNLSLKKDPKQDGFLASATQRRTTSPNAGLVVTARANEPAKAFARLLFCLTVLSHEERWEMVQPVSDPDRW